MNANKKFDLASPQCPNESKILANIINNHPLIFSVAASASVPWIYISQFSHTLKEDISKYKLKFVLHTKELTMTVADIPMYLHYLNLRQRTILDLMLTTIAMADTLQDICKMLNNMSHKSISTTPIQSCKYSIVLQVDVPMTQSQSIKSTQGTHTTTSAPRTPNPVTTEGESNSKAKQNVEIVQEHLEDEELDHLLEGTENADVDEFMNDIFNSQENSSNRIEPKREKESLEAENSADMVTINDEVEEESAGDEFKLKIREKGKGIEETRDTPPSTPIRSPRTHKAPLSTNKETL
ncbi:hypothetical protein Tco_0516116 [Tanacetum coccineum]